MKKRFQNKAAESKLAMPLTSMWAIGVWLLCGLVQHQLWWQFACFAMSSVLMVQLNNINALIRIYSRMVSCSFMALMCMACFLFADAAGAATQLSFIAFLLLGFMTYQDKQSVGLTYYAYLMLGIVSIFFVQILYLLPLIWLMSFTQLQSLSWRTWGASLLGLLTPYWFICCALMWTGDFTRFVGHFSALADVQPVVGFAALSIGRKLVLAFLVLMLLTGTVHFIRQHHNDKIRTRLLFGFFIWMALAVLLFMFLQPQHFDVLLHLLIVLTAPLIAHFLTLTSTKQTNVAFFVIVGAVIFITGYNLWTHLSLS